MDNQSNVYMAYDGDNAGRMCGRAILADNVDALHEVSARITLGHEIVKKWVEAHGGHFISGGGDEGVFSIPAEAIQNIEELRADYEYATNLTATIGVGSSLSEAGKAMLVGKFRGKNTVVQYDPSIEGEIKQAQANMSSGTASAEEKKLGEAYLQPEGTVSAMAQETEQNKSNMSDHSDCPYCQKMDAEQIDDPSHCRYCHDAEQQEPCPYCAEPAQSADSTHDCPYCQESGSLHDDCPYCKGTGAHDVNAADHTDDCPYCQESSSATSMGDDHSVQPTDGPAVSSPTTTDSENYAGQDLNQPDLPKPDAIQQNPDGLGTSFDTPTNENVKLDAQGQGGNNETHEEEVQSIDPVSEETVQEIAQQIDALPPEERPEAEAVNQVDAADMATGTNMDDGVSRPEDYSDENHPTDMGLAEDEQGEDVPDITSMLQEGLDNHADSINREKVINLVAEALEGFKASKGIIEKAKMQAPQLYESSIAMLKAMIEMCKMLGLDQEAGATNSENPLEESPANPASNDIAGGVPAGGEGNIPYYVQKSEEMDKAEKAHSGMNRVGTTRSGKHVYSSQKADSKHYKDFSKEDHHDAAAAHHAAMLGSQGDTKQQHYKARISHSQAAGLSSEQERGLKDHAESHGLHRPESHSKAAAGSASHARVQMRTSGKTGFEKSEGDPVKK